MLLLTCAFLVYACFDVRSILQVPSIFNQTYSNSALDLLLGTLVIWYLQSGGIHIPEPSKFQISTLQGPGRKRLVKNLK